jgi:hypothetical protein
MRLGHGDCHRFAMFVSPMTFFDLSLAANVLGVWSMTSASGVRHKFNSRTDALDFAGHEARKPLQCAQCAIGIEGADLKWRSLDRELKALVDGSSSVGVGQLSR